MKEEYRIEQAWVRRAERQYGVLSARMGVGRRNWPDRVFFKPTRVFFVEFKRPGEKPTVAQLHMFSLLRSMGYEVYVETSTVNLDEICGGKV